MASVRTNVLTATVSNVFNNACYFVFVIFLAKKYTVLQLSYYSLSFNIYFLATLFATLGISNLIIREYYSCQEKVKFVSTLLRIELLAGFLIYGLTIFSAWLANYEVTVVHFLYVVCAMILFDNISFIFSNVFISLREQQYAAIATMVEAGLKLVLGLYVYLTGYMSLLVVAGILVGLRVISSMIQVAFFIRHHRNAGQINLLSFTQFDRKLARSIFTYGKTFFAITLVVAAYSRLPIVLLSKLSSLEHVTYMDMGFKAFNMMGFIPTILVNTYYPTILKHIDAFGVLSEKTSRFIQAYLPVSNILIVVSCLLVPIAFKLLFGHKFDPSIGVFQVLVLSLSIMGITSTQANILFAHGMEKVDLVMNLVMFVVVIGLVVVLVPVINSLGAALSIFIARTGFLMVQRRVLRKKFPALVLRYEVVDAILVPLVLMGLVLFKGIPFGAVLLYVFSCVYLFSLIIRYRVVLQEVMRRFVFAERSEKS